MATLIPRPPYSQEELDKLYPSHLQLHQVQIFHRHGERTPEAARFQSAGLHPYWPYCSVNRQLMSMTSNSNSEWSPMRWKRHLEIFAGLDDSPQLATGRSVDGGAICVPGQLTDVGRRTTFDLGTRLRRLYVDQVKFLPAKIDNTDDFYLRTTTIPRALESLQQSLHGLYPEVMFPSFPQVNIITRAETDEQLYPNEDMCRRFLQLAHAYAQRTADRWNDSNEMAYLTSLIGKYMPESNNKVAVDSHPRLAGIMDTINSTLAHGPDTKLPEEFYDKKLRDAVDKIGREEWFGGFEESQEYRAIGIGSAMGDLVGRMVESVEGTASGGRKPSRFGLIGCHDVTLGSMLTSLGTFKQEQWPPYTSHIAYEVFRKKSEDGRNSNSVTASNVTKQKPWFGGLFGGASKAEPIGRRDMTQLSQEDKSRLDGYYVRIRYNDKVMFVPGCKPEGKHLEGDESFCTLAEFKSIVDKYTPKHYKKECVSNLGKPVFPPEIQPAGY